MAKAAKKAQKKAAPPTQAPAAEEALWEEHLRRDPFPWPACLLEFVEKVVHERKLLTRRMAEINQRLETIATRLAALGNDDRKSEVHELRAEAQTLKVLHRRFGDALANLDAPPGAEFQKRSASAARREAIIDAWEREQRGPLQFNIQRCESAGDFRQARVLRVQWLLIRDDVAKTLN